MNQSIQSVKLARPRSPGLVWLSPESERGRQNSRCDRKQYSFLNILGAADALGAVIVIPSDIAVDPPKEPRWPREMRLA